LTVIFCQLVEKTSFWPVKTILPRGFFSIRKKRFPTRRQKLVNTAISTPAMFFFLILLGITGRVITAYNSTFISLRLDLRSLWNTDKNLRSHTIGKGKRKGKGKRSIAVCNKPHCYGNSHAIWDVTCHQAEVTFPPLPQLKLILD